MLTGLIALFGLIAALASFSALGARTIEGRYPPAGVRVDVGGGAIHVLDLPAKGEAHGTVLLIHGASGNASDMFVALGQRLADCGFRVLSVDRPGHGWSDRVGGRAASSPVYQAALLRRAAEKLGVARAIVAAHSLGAIAGLALALDHPDFVQGLTLIAPVSHPWPGGVAWYYTVGGAPAVRAAVLQAPHAADRHVQDESRCGRRLLAQLRACRLRRIDPAALVLRPRHFRANCEDVAYAETAVAELSQRYGQIGAPTEVVTGDRDGVVYAHIHAKGLVRDIPRARLTTLEGMGHSPHFVAPDRIAAVILEAGKRVSRNDHVAA